MWFAIALAFLMCSSALADGCKNDFADVICNAVTYFKKDFVCSLRYIERNCRKTCKNCRPSTVVIQQQTRRSSSWRITLATTAPLAQPATARSTRPAPIECGTVAKKQVERLKSKVIRGKPSSINESPWQVALFEKAIRGNGSVFKCGASLIHKHWVLTAAHCVEGSEWTPARRFEVQMGANDIKRRAENGGVIVGVKKVYIHPLFDANFKYDHDVALLELEYPVQYTEKIRPICLSANDRNLIRKGKPGVITGWGWTDEENPQYPAILQRSVVDFVSDEECNNKYKDNYNANTMICAYRAGTDACRGDSGGPIAVKHDENRRYYQAGITSWGRGCARKGIPGIYARLDVECNFLEEVTNIRICLND